MPVRVFVSFLSTCPTASREYAALKNSTVEPASLGVDNIETLCGVRAAELLLDHAKVFYPEAVAYIQQAINSVHPYVAMQPTDERQIERRMNELAAEYSRNHDEKVRAEIFALAGRLVELKKRETLH